MMKKLMNRRSEGEQGFTLIELLVVIVILAILAAVVVFAVGGINDKGQTSACKADRKTLQTAEEAYFAQPVAAGGGNGSYGTEAQLAPKFISEVSDLHNIAVTGGGTGYTITPVAPC